MSDVDQAAEAAAELPGPDTGVLGAGEKLAAAAAAAVPTPDGGNLAAIALDRARQDGMVLSPNADAITARASAYLAWLKENA